MQEMQERPCGATNESAVLRSIRRALARVLFSVAVEGLALRACTLRSPGRSSAPCRAAFGLIAAGGGSPGSNLRGSSKPLSL